VLQFLCDGLEDDMTLKWAADHAAGKTPQERDIENYTRASGKMLLLHKLLPKLKAEGRQVSGGEQWGDAGSRSKPPT